MRDGRRNRSTRGKGRRIWHKLPDLSKTAAAIDEYDRIDARFATAVTGQRFAQVREDRERAGEEVGRVFGIETAAWHDPDDCRKRIRPGPAHPPSGRRISFVRRMVARWKEQT